MPLNDAAWKAYLALERAFQGKASTADIRKLLAELRKALEGK